MKIVFFGTPDFVIPVAKSLAEQFDLVGVVTSPDAPVGRKKVISPSPVKAWFMDYLLRHNKEGVILTPGQWTEEAAVKLRKLHPDLFVTAAYGKLIPKKILRIPGLNPINIHPSLLPKYRGPSPIQYALLNGDKTLGISIMQMDEELDHGPIYSQWEIPIGQNDTFESLHTKAFSDAAIKLSDIIKQIETGSIISNEQNHSKATFTQKITKEDGYFDAENPPANLEQMIKAYFPWPTAWTKIKIKNQESRIMKFLPDGYVQLEGKTKVKIKELLNGYPELTEIFEKLNLIQDS